MSNAKTQRRKDAGPPEAGTPCDNCGEKVEFVGAHFTEPNKVYQFATGRGEFHVMITDDGTLRIISTTTRRVLVVLPKSSNSIELDHVKPGGDQ